MASASIPSVAGLPSSAMAEGAYERGVRIDGSHEAALFDFGGVLTTPVWASFASFCRSEGLDPEALRELFRSDPQALADLRGLESGKTDPGEFERTFGARLGIERTDGLIDRLFEEVKPADEMLSTVGALRKAGLRTSLVSNSWSTDHYDRAMLDGLFDDVVISGEVGLHKPQPEIYLLAAERIEVAPTACIFVDDLRENCEGAEAVGMTAVRHREPAATRERLTELTGVELDG